MLRNLPTERGKTVDFVFSDIERSITVHRFFKTKQVILYSIRFPHRKRVTATIYGMMPQSFFLGNLGAIEYQM